MNEIEIEVKGRVQGVNFRFLINRFANKQGLRGYAMNREDGSVFIVAQGEKKELEKLILFVQTNPGFSKVEGLNYSWKKPTINYNEFRVVKDNGYILDKAKSLVNLGKFITGRNRHIPQHICIIPDGNRRWAKEKGLASSLGHYKAGNYSNLVELFSEAKREGVKYISLWGFSTENWKREDREVKAVFDVIESQIKKFTKDAHKDKIRFRQIGRKDRLPKSLRKEMDKLEEETKNYSSFNVQLCLDYGGRDEIVRAVNNILKKGVKKIDEKTFEGYLDTKGIPDPDLIIRTSGEYRTSGLMPYQGAYAELYFSEKYFPDFDAKELRKAIEEFGRRQRRFGGG